MNITILQNGDPILRKLATFVNKEDIKKKPIQEIIENMKQSMRSSPGVGLAAPQIGHSLRIIVIEDCEQYMRNMPSEIKMERGRKPIPFHVLINPEIEIIDDEKVSYFEGCLSVKGFSRVMPRYKSVKVHYLNENGEEQTVTADGWYARILQHEIDHLNGKLYIDFADKITEITNSEENREKWLYALADEINHFLKKF